MKCCVYVSVQFSCSFMSDSATPWATAHQASLSITSFRSLPKFMSIKSVMPSNHLILSHPVFLLPLIFPSVKVFYNELAIWVRWPKYWSFSISPSVNTQGWFPLGLTGLVSLQSREFGLVSATFSVASTEFTYVILECGERMGVPPPVKWSWEDRF